MKVYELIMNPTATLGAEQIVKIGQRELAQLAELLEQAGAQGIGVAIKEVVKEPEPVADEEFEYNAEEEFEKNRKFHEEWIKQLEDDDEEEDEDEDVEDEE